MNKKQDSQSNSTINPPVVAVLGHVDHGKTSLLDAIRKTNIVDREHGGITQKIGASSIEIVHEKIKRTITFIDTPGHAAFSAMRGRGAQAADIGILVVSATDGVMPQTKESIQILLTTHVPYIVVLTKADLDTKQVEKTKQQLLKEGVLLEGLGGDIPYIEVSSKTMYNVKELLDLILLVWDVKKSQDSQEKTLKAIIIESKLDIRSGPKATLVIKNGQLSVKDELVAGDITARVRALINDKGQMVTTVSSGCAVEVLGFEKVAQVGAVVYKKGEIQQVQAKALEVLDEKKSHHAIEGALLLILCADTLGSLEAILSSLPKTVHIMTKKTGEVSETDVLLAKSIHATILSFNVKNRNEVIKLAETEKVPLKNYEIIYELIDEVKDVLEGKRLALVEKVFGTAKLQAVFPFEKTKVLGVKVLDGRVAKGDMVRIQRNDQSIGEGAITSLRHGKESASRAEKGQEAGVIVSPLLDFTIGDMLICHS